MIARTSDLYDREVICVKEGIRLGTVGDVEINTATGNAESIVVFGKRKLFGLFGGGEDLIIPWCCVEVFGDEIVLVNYEPPKRARSTQKGILSKLFDFS